MTNSLPERKKLSGALIFLLILVGVSVFINYIDRGNLSMAAAMLQDELQINPAQLGLLLSAFFWTYACLQPVYGWLVDRLNVYWLFAACFACWSFATAATGLVHTFTALFLMRLLVGIGEAVSFPSYSKILALNYREEQRGVANGVLGAGLSIGPGFGMLVGGTMMARFGWRPFFLVLGLGSMLWIPFWIQAMPRNQVAVSENKDAAPSLSQFLRLRSAWGSCIGLFCGNYLNYFLLTWMPYYLMRERHFSMGTMAKIGASGYLLSAACSTGGGWLSDLWLRAGGTPTRVRKAFTAFGCAACGLLIAASALVPERTLSVILLLLAMGCFGVSASNIWAITQTLAGPQAAGRWTGFQNAFGNMAGVLVPIVTGFALRKTGHFQWAALIVAFVALIGAVTWYLIVGPVEQVEWGEKQSGATRSAAAAR